MFRLIIFIFSLIASSLFVGITNAAVTTTFIQVGNSIAMTGASNDARFDIRAALLWFDAGAPTLDTTTSIPTFTWAFYGSGIGWIVFESGSNYVSLDCGTQYLTGLTVNCKLTGTGWSENIGDIGFSGVVYNPNTSKLVWKATSYAGDIDLTDIVLPLKWVTINETSFIANSVMTLTISWAWMYEWSGSGWQGDYLLSGDSMNFGIVGTQWWNYTADLSLAWKYQITFVDPNWSITEITLDVDPWEMTTISEIWGTYAENFCGRIVPLPSSCPDGNTRKVTYLDKQPSAGSIVANGINSYDFTVKIRDKYGNRTGSGNTVDINYDTTVKNIQTLDNYFYGNLTTIDGEAFITDNLSSGLGGTSDTLWKTISDVLDFTYKISSLAPTNTTNVIKLTSLNYHSGSTPVQNIVASSDALDFDPLFTATISTPSGIPPVIGTPYAFLATVWGSDPIIVPTIVSTMFINDGTQSEWKNLISSPSASCEEWQTSHISSNDLCTKWEGDLFNNRSSIATKTNSNFDFTGTYLGNIPNPDLEGTSIKTYIYYQTGWIDILYNASSSDELALGNPSRPTQRMQIFGQTNTSLGLIGWENRIDLINTIRKNTTLFSRNRTSYNDVDYLIQSGNITIDETSFDTKRTIISIWGDITISTGVIDRNHPLSIIALTDSGGVGGNIIIDGAVRDIHSSLIAEHAITSGISDNQLYIHGLVSSANSPQEIAPTTCPYFVTSCANPSDYDLPYSRSGMLLQSPVTPYLSLSGSMFTPPVVIEVDTRITRDPPKVILK